ncbi:hypothetical protein SLS58_010458 [Diplodia intermedia]|uniref:Fungal STAND N-terminal Goodbye domain-containing protein n=1 Tax=Diplodia intermedia TaxID=856260 RepID=A0ABR3T683_9PEZI
MAETVGAEDIDKLWQKASETYKERTGEDLQHGPKLTIEEMEEELSKSFQGGDTREKIVKETLKRMIQVGAEVASNVTSSAFPGAGILFKAATPLIEISDHYQQYYTATSVHDTLERVLPHFNRIQTYVETARQGTRLNRNLVDIIFKILQHFLNICAIYSNVLQTSKHKKGRLKNLCKAIIGLDGGIRQELNRIDELVKNEEAQNNAESHGFTISEEGRRTRARNLKLIRDSLEIEESTQFLRPWKEMQETLRRRYVKGIGSWLPALEEFSTWKDVQQPAAPVLVLEADPGFGKTFLCSEIVETLQGSQTPRKNGKSSVAFFYFKSSEKRRVEKSQPENSSKSPANDTSTTGPVPDDHISIRDILISLIWQLTTADEEYQRYAASKMEHPASNLSCSRDLWDKLIKEYATFASSKCRKVFFLVIDGLDLETSKEKEKEKEDFKYIVRDIMEMPRSEFQIRMLVTGKCETLKDLEIDHGENSTLIHVAEHRHGDMKTFIKSRMSNFPRDRKDDEQADLLRKIEAKFCETDQYAFDSYVHVLPILDEVDQTIQTYGNNELRDILKRRPEDSCSAVAWQLKRLEGQLNDDEIEEFNDVLVCMVLLNVWPTIKQLTTFAWLSKDTRHQLALEQRIRDKYLHFFDLFDGDIVVSDPTMRYFLDHHPPEPEPNFEDETNHQSENHKSDVAIITRLAQAFCEGELPNTLEQLFKKLPASKPRIDLDCVDGRMKIVLCILRAVCTERRKHSHFLHEYAARYLLDHLGEVALDQLRKVPSNVKKEIGYYLHEFFMDTNSVETWVKQHGSENILDPLFQEKQQDSMIYRALSWEDEDVQEGIRMAASQEKYSVKEKTQNLGGDDQKKETTIGSRELAQTPTDTNANEKDETNHEESTDTASGEQGVLDIHRCTKAPQKALASLWLDQDDWDAEYGLWMLMKISQTEVSDLKPYPAEKWTQVDIHSLEQIWGWAIGVLGKGDKRQTSNRYRRLAETALAIQTASSNEQATSSSGEQATASSDNEAETWYSYIFKTCETAKRENPDNWRATWCIARTEMHKYREQQPGQDEHPALVTWETLLKELEAEENFRNEQKDQHDDILGSFLELCEKQNRPYKAVRAFGSLFDTFPHDVDLAKRAFDSVKGRNDRTCLKKLIQILGMIPEKGRLSPMTKLLHKFPESQEFHDNLWFALHDDPGLTIKCYTDAIKATVSISVVARGYLRFYYALALYHQHKVEEATEEWENIKLERSQFKVHPELRQLQAQISEKLALCYVQLTRSSINKKFKSDGETAYTKKIKELIQKGQEGKDTLMTDVRYLTLSLCRIHKLNGQHEEAKGCISSYVKAATDLLEDNTYDNDSEGYMALGEILVALDDEKSAKQAWSMINNTEDGHYFDLPIFCDGGCGHKWEHYPDTEIHIYLQGLWDGKARKEMKNRIAKDGDVDKMTKSWVTDIKNKYVVKKPNTQDHHRQWIRLHSAQENLKKFLRRRAMVSENRTEKDEHRTL